MKSNELRTPKRYLSVVSSNAFFNEIKVFDDGYIIGNIGNSSRVGEKKKRAIEKW